MLKPGVHQMLRQCGYSKVLVPAAVLFLTGCTISPGMRNEIDRGNVDVPGIELVELTPAVMLKELQAASHSAPAQSPQAIANDDAPYKYLLGAGDVVRVVVWEHPELNNPSGQAQGDSASSGRLIEPDGTLFFPYIGKIPAAGLTPSELRERIAKPLSKFIRDPQVDVRVTEFRSQRIYVTGEVGAPGPLFLNDTSISPLDAIANKGGFTELSNRYRAVLIRDGVSTELKLDDATRGGALASLRLRSGDQLHVADVTDDKIFLLGEFAAQKTIIRGRSSVSLAEALAEGGGIQPLGANAAAVFVFRRREGPVVVPADGQQTEASVNAFLPKVYALDLTRAESLLLAERFSLEPRDVVYVASTDFSKYNRIIGQILPTISAYFQLDRLINN